MSLRQMEQEGVGPTATASVVSELSGEHPMHAQIMRG
jgi:hypothetical protein